MAGIADAKIEMQGAMRAPAGDASVAYGQLSPDAAFFSRQLIRRMHDEGWQIGVPRLELDANGFGVAVITARAPAKGGVYSLVAYSHDLDPERRSDRVIADAWDATFTLYDGEPDAATIAAMHPHVSTQEEGRHRQGQLTLSRANKSVRMFEHVVGCLAQGRQPDPEMVNRIGYLMRTTAVYGNGKFGISDRDRFKDRDAMAAPFMAEMLTVYLIRHFSLLLWRIWQGSVAAIRLLILIRDWPGILVSVMPLASVWRRFLSIIRRCCINGSWPAKKPMRGCLKSRH